jgi:hypothetical protein
MGEAKRKALAGYVPPMKEKVETIKHGKVLVTGGGISTMAMVAAMLADYPKLPRRMDEE